LEAEDGGETTAVEEGDQDHDVDGAKTPEGSSIKFETAVAAANGSNATTILEVEGLSLRTPDKETKLTEHLDLTVGQGDSLLVIGRSGVGKTSVLRALAGLWNTGEGTVKSFTTTNTTDSDSVGQNNGADTTGGTGANYDIFFLPQRPYMVLGTLRDQLLYPNSTSDSVDGKAQKGCKEDKENDDDFLNQVLYDVLLGDLLERCETESPESCGLDAEMDWANTLSLGEQQRLAFARLLVNKPSLAILDESTSALDVQTEEKMYSLLKKFGITYLSVGHRPTLLKYHAKVLQLQRDKDSYSASLMGSEEMDMETYLMSS
jgi:ABC-type uncharacterized transport system fused permease/ATPase subunit